MDANSSSTNPSGERSGAAPLPPPAAAAPTRVIVQALPDEPLPPTAATTNAMHTSSSNNSAPMAMAIPATSKSVPFEGLHSSVAADVPYAVAQPTPGALPPIATARPVLGAGAIASHGGSNLPLSGGAQQYNGAGGNAHLPHIATQAPMGVDYEHSQFEFLDKTRWWACIMLMYYIGTFIFFQPFVLGVVGMMTAFIGYYGARPPMDAVRMKWIRSYVWLNYIMIVFNICLLGITFTIIAINSASTVATTATTATDDDSADDYAAYYSFSAAVVVVILVVVNVLLHVRGIQTGRAFYAELERAQVQNVVPAIILMTAAHVA